MMFLSAFDDSLPPFLPLEEDQLGRSAEDHQWLVKFDEDIPLVPVQPIFHSTFDNRLPSLLLSRGSQPDDEFIENHLWPAHLDEPDMQNGEPRLFDWLQLPELASVTVDPESDIIDKEILRLCDELSDNQAPNQPIAPKEGLLMLVTRPETPSNENEGVSPHKTTFEHSPRSVHHESTTTPYLQEEVKEAMKIPVLSHVLRDGHHQEGSEVPRDPKPKRKREGHTQSGRSPKRPHHDASPPQESAIARFDSAIYLENSTQQQTFQWRKRRDIKWKVLEERYQGDVLSCFDTDPGSLSIYVRPEAGDQVCMMWDEISGRFVGIDFPGGREYEARMSEMEGLLKNPGQSIELKYWKR
ncbi:hypothetical protein NPX13_g5282 [Xylaria arbuscula]|uniref:Uncharacterized protein n=1 Tax=Xylaria arbuscula TaxID=114810 RepID=A0A9W8TLF6_9PEZI|nr:hypothetical protein NPX13_g5282 [Xylaria arbuscula]